MMTDLKAKTRIFATVAATALMAGPALAESAGVSIDADAKAMTETSRAASDDGTALDTSVSAGVNASAEDPEIADSRSASHEPEADHDVVTDTQPGAAQGPKADTELTGQAIAEMTVGDLVGKNVLSASGDDVGEIDYVIKQGGKVVGVIGVGGFLGLGEHTVGVPLEEFEVTANGQLQLDSKTEAELEAMPEVDEDMIEPLDHGIKIGDHV